MSRVAVLADPDAALRAELAELRERVERLERRSHPRDADDTRVLLALAGCVDVGPRFSARDVIRHARVIRERAPELAEALESADCESPKSLGRLFARVEGRALRGLRLDRVSENRRGLVWGLRFYAPHETL